MLYIVKKNYLFKSLKLININFFFLYNLFNFQLILLKLIFLTLNINILIFIFFKFLILYYKKKIIYFKYYNSNIKYNNFIYIKLYYKYNLYLKFNLKKKIINYNFFIYINIYNKYLYKILIYNIYIKLYKIIYILYKKNFFFKIQNLFYINFINKIIELKRISHTKKSGRKRKFRILLIFGNKSGWIGLGIGYSIYISDAISKAKQKAFKNIKYFKFTKSKTIPNILKKTFKNITIILKPLYICFGFKVPLIFKPILLVLGLINIWIKIIGSSNKLNLIYTFFFNENILSQKEIFKFKYFFFNKIERYINIKTLLNLLLIFI